MWSRILAPSSGWNTSRPLNMIVTLTLWPSERNSATFRVLVSKSPTPILGRYFISLTETLDAFRRDSLARCFSSYCHFRKSMIRHTGGVASGRHLHQVQIALLGHPQGVRQRHDADLLAVLADEADLTGADAVVDPVLVGRGYGRSLLRNGLLLPGNGYGRRAPSRRRASPLPSWPTQSGDAGAPSSIDPGSRRAARCGIGWPGGGPTGLVRASGRAGQAGGTPLGVRVVPGRLAE